MVRARPETLYAWSGEVSIAYQVHGDGPIDLVLVPGWVSHLEVAWEHPGCCKRPGEVLVSTVRALVLGSGLARGCDHHVLKAVPESWQLFALAEER